MSENKETKKSAKSANYLSAKESRRISRQNRKITTAMEKKYRRKNVPESEYLTQMRDPRNVVEFDDLHSYFFTDTGTVKAVDGVSYEVPQGMTVGVVGESGCGKSVTSLSLMQLLQRPQGQIVSGSIRLNLGDKAYDVAKMPMRAMEQIRGNQVSMIFQEPMTSLNPVFRIGAQVDEVIKLHNPTWTKQQVKARTIEMLEMVGIANSEGVYKMYPHELSGGMRQRVMISIALACNPRLIIADEPTTALDVTIQAQIMDLILELNRKLDMGVMLITHDLSVVAEVCSRVVVMYLGQIVEEANVDAIFDHPGHPYTVGLIRSIPRIEGERAKRLYQIRGTVPMLDQIPTGCRFAPRCPFAQPRCFEEMPELQAVSPRQSVRCWRAGESFEEGGEA